jgi:DNA-binding PadR family transcriptional regulator
VIKVNPREHPSLSPLAAAILNLLRDRDLHPYEIHQLIRDHCTDQVVKVTPGALYHTVERLARRGLIEAVQTERSGRRPERTVYAITDRGLDEFHACLRVMVRAPQPEYPVFGVAMEMLSAIAPAEAIRLLERRGVALEAALAASEQTSTALLKRGLSRIALIEIEYAQAMTRAELAWVRDLIEDIRTGDLPWIPPTGALLTCPARQADAARDRTPDTSP